MLKRLTALSILLPLAGFANAQTTLPSTQPTTQPALRIRPAPIPAEVVAPAPRSATPAAPIYDRFAPSVVAVRFTFDGELGRRELEGIGVVVSPDGLIMTSMGITPSQVPDDQMKDFKIIIPGDDDTEIDAIFQGRDERTGVSFVRPKETRAWKPIKFDDAPVVVGQRLFSLGLLPKEAAFQPYLTTTTVAANLRGPTPQVLVNAEGLGPIGSPVFNESGVAVGLVNSQNDQSAVLNDPREPMRAVVEPPRTYTPSRDFLISIADPPAPGSPIRLPSVGIAQLSGLKKEVAEYFGLTDQPAVQIGDVIPNFPADKAGIQSGDIIVRVNGEPLERGDQPEEVPQIMTRKLSRLKVGSTVTFSILRGGKDQPLKDITVALQERPRQANKAARFWAEDLGFSTRELVFDDTYLRRLPADTKGVAVTLVKPNSSAQSGKLAPGDLITQLNQTPVESLAQFKEQYEQFRKTNPRDAVVLEVLRGVNTQVIRIEPPQ